MSIDVYLCSPQQKFTCGVCNASFSSVTKMASHIKTDKNCATNYQKGRTTNDFIENCHENTEIIEYIHGKTKLGCSMCKKESVGGGCAITSLPVHFARYCGK